MAASTDLTWVAPNREVTTSVKGHIVCGIAIITAIIFINLGRYNEARADVTGDALTAITDTADRICGIVAASGESKGMKVEGDVNAQLSSLLKKLANLGISVSVGADATEYQGVLQADLATTLKNLQDCKLKVLETLSKRLLPESPKDPSRPSGTESSKENFTLVRVPGQSGWSVDPNSGCHIWNQELRPDETVAWTGGCDDGMASGFGVLEWRAPDGLERYVGNLVNGKIKGSGIFSFPNGFREEGEFSDGLLNGHASVIWGDGTRLEGEFHDDLANGYAVKTWPNGARLEGEFRHGAATGFGRFTYPDGTRIEGQFRDDVANGHGVIFFLNGIRIEGEFHDSSVDGHAVKTFADGTRLEGEFRNGLASGRGVENFPDGGHFEGLFREDVPNGRGIYTTAGGDRYEGRWSNGCFKGGDRQAAVNQELASCR